MDFTIILHAMLKVIKDDTDKDNAALLELANSKIA